MEKVKMWHMYKIFYMMIINQLHTRGVSCPKKLSSWISLSSLASDNGSTDGELSVSREWESLDSVWKWLLSAWGVEGVLIDFIPLDFSLELVKAPKPLSRFWKNKYGKLQKLQILKIRNKAWKGEGVRKKNLILFEYDQTRSFICIW